MRIWPEPFRPGSDWVRDMVGAMLAADRERVWPWESGDAVRGRYGSELICDQAEGVLGEVGLGSLLRRGFAGFWSTTISSRLAIGVPSLKDGTGDDLKASIRSVSGTGSILRYGEGHMGADSRG